jgi:hypothetical protein
MSAQNNGGAAFPVTEQNGANFGDCGMTLRDYFAAKTMQGMCANPVHHASLADAVADAYRIADAMLAERAK